jgi:acetoin:2,6-dichlorophenolindophenol oxidoreductase subunit beta
MNNKYNYGTAICSAFEYLLENYPEVFVIGQGLWSPWYVGNSMTDLDKKFGEERVIDTPVSESATTGAAVGASLAGMKPIVVHPRMDFMLYAVDSIVNQAAKWSHMMAGQDHPSLTIRSIINRGGEQGAQHSQALHSWFAHIPGLRVVMPASVADARDLLIASVLCDDPVMYIDDRWLYDQEECLPPIKEIKLIEQGPKCILQGNDITIVGCSFTTLLAKQAAEELLAEGISVEVIDFRILNPIDASEIVKSVSKTGRLIVVDSGTKTAGFAAEIITSVCERIDMKNLKTAPIRVTLEDAPAPTSRFLEKNYYLKKEDIVDAVKMQIFNKN